jgi:hypothetical protein
LAQHVVAAGDVAPLVGHNAFLRMSALRECAFVDPADGQRKVRSELQIRRSCMQEDADGVHA